MHKNKKATVISVNGSSAVNFLNNSTLLSKYERLVLRPGLFHQLASLDIAKDSSIFIEVENSSNRNDIIRLKDNYGRTHEKYTWNSAHDLLSSSKFTINDDSSFCIDQRPILRPQKFSKQVIFSEHIYIIVSGGLCDSCGTFVAESGDVLTGRTLLQLTDRFTLVESALFICRILLSDYIFSDTSEISLY